LFQRFSAVQKIAKTEGGVKQYGYLKNFNFRLFFLIMKNNALTTFSKPHTLE
jgi:hypothetical protein